MASDPSTPMNDASIEALLASDDVGGDTGARELEWGTHDDPVADDDEMLNDEYLNKLLDETLDDDQQRPAQQAATQDDELTEAYIDQLLNDAETPVALNATTQALIRKRMEEKKPATSATADVLS